MDSLINKPDAIIFDWDNTLVDTGDNIRKTFLATLKYMGIEPKAEYFEHYSARDLFPKIFGKNFEKAQQYFYNNISINNKLPLFDYSEQTVNMLFANNIPLAIISNKEGVLLNTEINNLHWQKYFAIIVGSKDCNKDKPSVVPVDFVRQKLNLTIKNTIWFIGDSEVDMQCALNSGCISIIINNKILFNIKDKQVVTFNNIKNFYNACQFNK